MPPTVTVVAPESEGGQQQATDVAPEQLQAYLDRGFAVQSGEARQAGIAAATRKDQTSLASTVAGNIRSAGTFGVADMLDRMSGGEDAAIYSRHSDEAHPYGAVAGQIIGSLIPIGAPGHLAKALEGAGGATVAGAALRGSVEGGAMGFGQGLHELSQSDDLSAEHISSTLSSDFLLGGGIGGIAGGASKLAELGISKASQAIEDHIAQSAKASEIPAEISSLDKKGLDALQETHTAELKTARTTEQAKIADDLQALRKEMVGESKIYTATKGEDVKAIEGIGELSAQQAKADRQLRDALNNRVTLAEKPERALSALQYQQGVLEDIQKLEPQLRSVVAADTSGTRAAGLDAIQPTLEKNLALQARIKATQGTLSSPTLDAIGKAREVLKAAPEVSKVAELGKVAIQGPIMHAVAGMIPIPGVGHLVGAAIAKKATDLMFGRVAGAVGENAARSAAALKAFAGGVSKATAYAPRTATSILGSVKYANRHEDGAEPDPKAKLLDELYRKRTAEIRSQVEPGPTGDPVMRFDARAQMAEQFKPLRAFMPQLADKLESVSARKVEYLASKIPKKPDMISMLGGRDMWKPAETDMRSFARTANAVEDPGSVEEHLADGTITPEEANAYNACYPERAAQFKQAITLKLPQLRESLPYAKRLALSIFSGAPVDAAMAPGIMQTLQATFASQDGGGTQAPAAQPQFGSVKKSVEAPTASQSRGNPT